MSMQITRLKLKNWRNFRHLDIPLSNRTYVIGANASGKSNLLDVFRFLRDVSKPSGGGLQKAVADRDGITKLRCLQARKDTEVRIDLTLASEPGAGPEWQYILGFKGYGSQGVIITEERVLQHGKDVIKPRPDKLDKGDELRLTQTALEQINANREFRDLVDSTPGIVWEADARSNDFTYVSQEAERLLDTIDPAPLPPAWRAAHASTPAGRTNWRRRLSRPSAP